jgi:hypothetical protein
MPAIRDAVVVAVVELTAHDPAVPNPVMVDEGLYRMVVTVSGADRDEDVSRIDSVKIEVVVLSLSVRRRSVVGPHHRERRESIALIGHLAHRGIPGPGI